MATTTIGNTAIIFLRLPQPITGYPKIQAAFLRSKLLAQFPTLNQAGSFVEFNDDVYQLIPRSVMSTLMDMDIFKQKPYSSAYDCDNYSFSLKGAFENLAGDVPLGIAHVNLPDGGKHSLNIWYNSDLGRYQFVEPQTGQIFDSNVYKPYMVII